MIALTDFSVDAFEREEQKPESLAPSDLDSVTTSSSGSESLDAIDGEFAVNCVSQIPSAPNSPAPALREKLLYHGLWTTVRRAHDSEMGRLNCGRRVHLGNSDFVYDQTVSESELLGSNTLNCNCFNPNVFNLLIRALGDYRVNIGGH